MMLKRAYVEITSVCNLRCSFCPGTGREARFLSPEEFRLLARRLRPSHAVISCSAVYNPRKDRPSAEAAALLEAEGARVWYTDSFSRPGQATACWESVDFTILRDGTILAPDSREGGGRTI